MLNFEIHFDLLRANLNSSLFDIPNQAKRHWDSISPTHHAQNIRQYNQRLQLLCAINEFNVPAFVGPAERGHLVDDIETMFN
jgi:hypothetical protein